MTLLFRNFWPATTWTVVILVLTLLPGNYIPKVGSFWNLFSPDKLIHLFLFGVFAFALLWGINRQRRVSKKTHKDFIETIILAVILAVITEVLQVILPIGRNGNLYDGIADIFGAGLGCVIFWVFRKNQNVQFNES